MSVERLIAQQEASLLPCPLCGTPPGILPERRSDQQNRSLRPYYVVFCRNRACGVTMPPLPHITTAVDRWNQRPTRGLPTQRTDDGGVAVGER